MGKAAQIHSHFEPMHEAGPCEILGERSCPMIWEQFSPVGLDEVDRVLNAISATTCQLVPCPSWMVTSRWVQPVSNISLQGTFKKALVHPLHKTPLLDPTCLDNFHPVSKLPFLGKVVEKVAAILDEMDYLETFSQDSGPVWDRNIIGHIIDDRWWEWDWSGATILAFHELSVAFNTIDHGILLGCLWVLGLFCTGLAPLSKAGPISINTEWEVQPPAALLWHATGHNTPSTPL